MKQEFEIQVLLGSGWTALECFTDNLALTRAKVENQIFDRFQVSGTIKVIGQSWLALQTLANYQNFVPCRILQNGTLQVAGELNIKTNTDNFFYLSENTFKVVDAYTTLLANRTVEVNILEGTQTLTANAEYEKNELTFKINAFTDPTPPIGSFWLDLTDDPLYNFIVHARQEKTVNADLADLLISQKNGWEELADLGATKTIVRNWVYTGLTDPIIHKDPSANETATVGIYEEVLDDPDARTINSQHSVSTSYFPDALTATHLFSITFTSPFKLTWYFGVLNERYYKNNITHTNCRSFFECVEKLIETIDPDLNVDTSGTSSDSFYFLRSLETQPSEFPYQNLLIQPVGDTILNDDNTKKSNLQTVLNWSFERLERFLKQSPLNLYWQIETRGGDLYFVTKHLTEISKSAGVNPSLLEWTVNNNRFTYPEKNDFRRIKRNGVYGGIDFVGKDIVYPNLNSSETLDITESDFYTDLQYSYDKKAAFPSTSLTATFLFSCDPISGNDYEVRGNIGVLTGYNALNGDLSLANLDNYFFADAKDNLVNINGADYAPTAEQTARLKETDVIKVPIFYMLQEYVFYDLVEFEQGYGEIIKISKQANQNFGEITLRF